MRPNERACDPGSRFRRSLLLLIVALIHLGLGLVLSRAQRPRQDLPPRRPIELRIVVERSPAAVPAGAATPPRRGAVPSARRTRSTVAATVAPVPTPIVVASPDDAAPADLAAAEPGAAASAPRGSLLDTEATRRAIRAATREPLLSERAAAAMRDEPLSAEQKLAREMARAGKSECLKGEFLGGGAGLISLPFWLLAEARGQCRR